MGKKTEPSRLIDFSNDLDPAVAGLLSSAETRKATRAMTSSQRKKAARDRARNKLTIDCPAAWEEKIKSIANDLSIPVSGLVVFLVNMGLENITMEEIKQARNPSRSMKYEYVLPYEGEK